MKGNDNYTCPYCGSDLEQLQGYYCDFCVMNIPETMLMKNHERLPVRVRDFALEIHLEKTTPELMTLSTFELLSLLKYARSERTSSYHLMNTFYKARKQLQTNDFVESEKYSGKDYEKITRKMFVLENIIRQRLGYVPYRITDTYLENYLAQMQKEKQKPMIIRQERKNEVNGREQHGIKRY